MQTFLSDPSFDVCAQHLDRLRLASQRREVVQIARANDPYCPVGTPELIARKEAARLAGETPKRGWQHHAAVIMWRGRLPALMLYLAAMDREWLRRGYKSNLVVPDLGPVTMPSWLGDDRLHSSHRSALRRKLPEHYDQFGWTDDPAAEYFWPGPCVHVVPGSV